MTRKLILFDWGGVLGHTGEININPVEVFQKIGQRMGITGCDGDNFLEKVRNFISISKEFSTLTTISDTYSDIYIAKLLKCVYNLEATYENISLFKKVFLVTYCEYSANEELVKYAHSLKERCFIGLLSNCAMLEKPKQDMDIQRSKFDYVYLSCDLGCRKPDPLIYNIANATGMDIFFVDDRAENLVYPRELGWKVYLFDGDNQKLINEIENFLQF